MYRFHWKPEPKCNYKCSYCEYARHIKTSAVPWTIQDVRDMVVEWHIKLGPIIWEIGGAEPTQDMGVIEAVCSVPENDVRIASSLSFDPHHLIRYIDPKQLRISSSFHPTETTIEEYIGKVNTLTEMGYVITTGTIVAWPPFLDEIPEWIEQIAETGINTTVHLFIGKYKGEQYPAAYTDGELEFIYGAGQKNVTTPGEFSGVCRAGHTYIWAMPDGTAYRCHAGGKVYGNLFDDIEFDDEPQPCDQEQCTCQHLRVMLTE